MTNLLLEIVKKMELTGKEMETERQRQKNYYGLVMHNINGTWIKKIFVLFSPS